MIDSTNYDPADADLDVTALRAKYDPDGEGEHPFWTREEWRVAVGNENTLSGYWDWAQHQIEAEAESEEA